MNLANYQPWANKRIFNIVRELPGSLYYQDMQLPYHSIHGTLNHLIAAHHLWQFRLTKAGTLPPSLQHVFYPNFDEVAKAIDSFDSFWINFLRN